MRRARSSEPTTCAGLAYFLAAALFFSLRFILDVFLLTVSPSREVLTAVRFSSSVISSVIFSASKALLGAILDSAVKAFKLESCTSLGALKFWALILGATRYVGQYSWSVATEPRYIMLAIAARFAVDLCRKVGKQQLIITLPSGRVRMTTKAQLFGPLVTYATFLTRCTRGKEQSTTSLARNLPAVVRFVALLLLGWSTRGAVVASPAAAAVLSPPPPLPSCRTYAGFPLECSELERARAFNRDVMPSLRSANYRKVRSQMTAFGLSGFIWHVGHACPDPSKQTTTDKEDYGWNLFAQHAVDNAKLSGCLVSCKEARHAGASVPCTDGIRCERNCTAGTHARLDG